MLTLIVIIAGIIQLIVSVFVLMQGRRNLSNILFFLIGISSLAWALMNYITIIYIDSPDLILFVRLILLFVVLQNAFFYMFARTFPNAKWRHSKKGLVAYGIFTFVAAITTISPYVFTTVTIEEGLPVTSAGPGILIFIAHAALSIFFAFKELFAKKRKSSGSQASQFKILIIASLLNWVLVPITNFAITPALQTTFFIVASPIYTLVFASLIAYAILKHEMFDIRTAIARSVAYILSLGTMLVVYVVFIFGITGLFLDNSTIDNTQKLIYAVFAVLVAFTFQPLKNFFDKLTDKIFYRDKYNSETILSEYTDFLVDEIDTEKVVSRTLTLMDEIANPTTSLVVLYKEGMGEWHDKNGLLLGDKRDELAKALEYQAGAVYIADTSNAKTDPFLENIKQHMSTHSMNVSVRLSTHGQLEGFILLGGKKSGTRYTQKDLGFFVTIANELSVSLQNSQRFDQIQRFNVTLQREVDEATAQLKQTNQKLKQLDTAKDEFISMASHQLRTPLTAVKGYVSMVMDGDAGDVSEEQKKLLGEAFSSSQRMVYLIADLLNVSRIKTGKFVIEPVEVNLAEMVQEEVDQLTPTATTRQILIKYSAPTKLPTLMLDETKTRQVIMNFIDNAIYYTKGGGDIAVSIVAKKDHVEYRVKDSGIGIPAADQHKLFTKFFRATNAKKARPDGTGLGLYMAQKIITAQGGSITFKSTEGKGSTFGFNMPTSKKNT